MSRFFSEDWFYLAFTKPDCKIQYDDSGIDLEVSADTTEEQRRYLNKDLDTLTISMGIDAADFSPCVIIVNVPQEECDIFDDEDQQAAFRAFGRLVQERYGKGIVSHWHQQLNRDIPGYRSLNELELSIIQKKLSEGKYSEWMFRTASEALRGLDACISGIAKDLDEMGEYNPVALDWLNCACDLKNKIFRYGLPAITEPNMFYGIQCSRLGFKVKYYYFRLLYTFSDTIGPINGESLGPVMSGYTCSMLSSSMPWLTCAEFAERYGVSEETALDWIHRGEIRTAAEDQQGWKILSGALPPDEDEEYEPQTYIPITDELPAEAIEAYPFLSRLAKDQWFQIRETETGSYSIVLIPEAEPDVDGKVVAVLNREEREKFEYDLLRAAWVRYDMQERMMRMDNHTDEKA